MRQRNHCKASSPWGRQAPKRRLSYKDTFKATIVHFQLKHYGACRSCPEVFLSINLIFYSVFHDFNMSMLKSEPLNSQCSWMLLDWVCWTMGPPCMALQTPWVKSPQSLCLRLAWLWKWLQSSPCLWLPLFSHALAVLVIAVCSLRCEPVHLALWDVNPPPWFMWWLTITGLTSCSDVEENVLM